MSNVDISRFFFAVHTIYEQIMFDCLNEILIGIVLT